MAITFGGLATGLDTGAIVEALMEIERQPIDRLERDKAFYNNRINAFSQLDEKLKSFQKKAEAIDSALELNSPAVNLSSEEFLMASADGRAELGSFQVTVSALAKQQKDVSQGYVDKTASTFGVGALSLTVGGVANSITIDSTNNSLSGIATAINVADVGVSATIINDGTASPYRLVLTGDNVSDSFTLDASGLSGGTEGVPSMTNTQAASQAHVVVDGIDIYADSNSVDSAIPGLSLELLRADNTQTTTLNISTDKEATEAKVKEFADAYNDVINFFNSQESADWGNDSAFRSIKRNFQSMLVSSRGGGSYSTLSQLGFETQRDGTVVLNSSMLNTAMVDDYQGLIELFAGDGTTSGVSTDFASYLADITDRADGIYAIRKEGTDRNLRRIDMRIDSLEVRMEQKEETLRAQFTAMESLVSGLNSQGSYLMQQLSSMPSLGGSGS